jgi:hypothetical protein
VSNVTADLEISAKNGFPLEQRVDGAAGPLQSRLETVEGMLRDEMGPNGGEFSDAQLQAMADNLRDVNGGIAEIISYLYRDDVRQG